MHVGMASIFQNPGRHTTDREVYEQDMRLACLAEPLGFDSVWTVEHHFTDYTMCPDPLQFLTYMAGRTTRVQLGSMVVVLPWHDPMRVAEQISMLDHLSGGRLILGLGRGARARRVRRLPSGHGRFASAFRRERRVRVAGSRTGLLRVSRDVREAAAHRHPPHAVSTFRGRTYAAAVSPESLSIMAKLGVGILVVPQKPWEAVEAEIAQYNELYKEHNGAEPPAPILAGWTFVDPDRDRAYEYAKRYIGGYWQTVLDHYQFGGDHLKGQKGYEYYGRFADNIQKHGPDAAIEFFLNIQTWGTPETCVERIIENANRIGAETYVGVFSYAGMPWDEAERNLRLFSESVMPKLQARAIRAGAIPARAPRSSALRSPA